VFESGSVLLNRGRYGIEYDGSQQGSGGRLWWLAVLIPVVLIIFLLRGCGSSGRKGIYDGDDFRSSEDGAMPTVQVERQRPSFASHFIASWKRTFQGQKAERPAGQPDSESAENQLVDAEELSEVTELKTQQHVTSDLPKEVGRLIRRSDELRDSGKLMSARMMLEKLRLRSAAADFRTLIEKRIGRINVKLIFSGEPMPGKVKHTISSGDVISRLSRKYGNTQEYILRVNAIEHPEKIRIGQKLWVLDNPIFELMIDKSDYRAVLFFNHRFFKTYMVGLGSDNVVQAGSYAVAFRRTAGNSRQEAHREIVLHGTSDSIDEMGFSLHAAKNLSAVGRSTKAEGILFMPEDIDEIYALLPSGAVVTIVE
jgi:LysM repeat protein